MGNVAVHDSGPRTLEVGRLRLHRCDTPAPWCGTLVRPLDPAGEVAGDIGIYFEYYPHTGSGPAAGTLVATEGGPGYPATETREEYLGLFGPLRATHDVVIMDNRGTGRSGAVDCAPLQRAPALTEELIGECGASLGDRATLYSTALAADDLAALLDALGIERVGLYGDSYGTYTAQVFARRHPGKLRALILDGAYPLDGPDYPWYPHYAPAMRDKFNLACARSPACSALPGDSIAHIEPALEALRARPLPATVRHGAHREAQFTADATQLATVMFGAAPAYASLRETDAAARAFVAGDTLPLLRLMAESREGVDSREPDPSPRAYSAGLAAAVSCLDPRQIFDMRLPPAERVAERDRLIAARERTQPASYAPFTIAEYRGMPLDYAFIDACVRWPAAPRAPLVSADPPYPDVPVLVISGDLDNMTPPADGAAAAAHFPRAHHVLIANGLHVNALAHSRDGCAAVLARRFLATLSTGDEACAGAVPPVRLVPLFAQYAGGLPAARAASGNLAGEAALQAVTAALLTCEDVIARVRWKGAGEGVGLRAGSFRAARAGQGYRVSLDDVRWTLDVGVSGRIDWPGRKGQVRARVSVTTPQGTGTLALGWAEGERGAVAHASGTLAGARLAASAPAP